MATIPVKAHLDLEDNHLKQGPWKQVHNPTTGNWELYIAVDNVDVLFAVFELDGDKVHFRVTGEFEEAASL